MFGIGPQPIFYNRTLTAALGHNTSLRYNVNRELWNVMGGCDQADIDVQGDIYSLWDLANMLRCGVEIHGRYGWQWWGYVHEIVIHEKNHDISLSLDRLSNRVAVAYNYTGPGSGPSGVAGITAYNTDALSIATYGTKDLLLSSDKLTPAGAVKWRDVKLAEFSKPSGTLDPANNEKPYATILCRGWWYTLEWRMAFVDYTDSISYTTADTTQTVHTAGGDQRVSQQITVGAANINVGEIALYVSKTGTPRDDLQVSIFAADPLTGDATGDALFTSSINAYHLGASLTWEYFAAEEFTLLATGIYVIVVERTGDADAVNYYSVGVNTGLGYAGGVLRLWDGSQWVARSPDADLLFKIRINPQVAVNTQIATLLTTYSQFVSLLNNGASTEVQGSYLPGDTSLMQVLEDFMSIGGANTRRILANVLQSRKVNFYEEPRLPARRYVAMKDGRLYINGRGAIIEDCQYLIGQYIDAQDTQVNWTCYSRMDAQFIESVEWTPESGIQLRYKGKPAPEDEY